MISIPENIMPDNLVDRACEEIARQIEAQRMHGTYTGTYVKVFGEAEGGYPDSVLMETGKRYASKGWHVYIADGGKVGCLSLHVSGRDMWNDWVELGVSHGMVPVTSSRFP